MNLWTTIENTMSNEETERMAEAQEARNQHLIPRKWWMAAVRSAHQRNARREFIRARYNEIRNTNTREKWYFYQEAHKLGPMEDTQNRDYLKALGESLRDWTQHLAAQDASCITCGNLAQDAGSLYCADCGGDIEDQREPLSRPKELDELLGYAETNGYSFDY